MCKSKLTCDFLDKHNPGPALVCFDHPGAQNRYRLIERCPKLVLWFQACYEMELGLSLPHGDPFLHRSPRYVAALTSSPFCGRAAPHCNMRIPYPKPQSCTILPKSALRIQTPFQPPSLTLIKTLLPPCRLQRCPAAPTWCPSCSTASQRCTCAAAAWRGLQRV